MSNDIEKSLEQELKDLYNYYDECKAKHLGYRLNTISSKSIIGSTIGLIAFFPVLSVVGKVVDFSTLMYPITTVFGIGTLLSAATGYLGQRIVTKIYRKKYKISDLKSNQDTKEKTMYYELEKAKCFAKEKIFKSILLRRQYKAKIKDIYSNELRPSENVKNESIEQLKNKQERLTKYYKEKCDELDVIVTQKFLSKKFKRYRTKEQRVSKILDYCFNSTLFATLIFGIPLSLEVISKNSMDISLNTFLKYFGIAFIPGLITLPFAVLSANKSYQENHNIFNSINNQLKQNALSEEPNYEYESDLVSSWTDKVSEIVELRIILEEVKCKLQEANNQVLLNQQTNQNIKNNLNNSQKLEKITPSFSASYEPSFLDESDLSNLEINDQNKTLIKRKK